MVLKKKKYKLPHQNKYFSGCPKKTLKKIPKTIIADYKRKKGEKQEQKWEFESLLFSWATLIQMNQAELHPPTVPEELLISMRSITITAALLNTNCFMWIPQAEGYINIELDKVLFFSFYVLFFHSFLTLQQRPQVGLALKEIQALTSKSCSSLMIALQKGFLLT